MGEVAEALWHAFHFLTLAAIIVLPAITFVFLHYLDYYTTVHGYLRGAVELNSEARSLLESGDFYSLLVMKATHVALALAVYFLGLYLLHYGLSRNKDGAVALGMSFILAFFFVYLIVLLAVYTNVHSLI